MKKMLWFLGPVSIVIILFVLLLPSKKVKKNAKWEKEKIASKVEMKQKTPAEPKTYSSIKTQKNKKVQKSSHIIIKSDKPDLTEQRHEQERIVKGKDKFEEEEKKADQPDKFMEYEVGIRTAYGKRVPDYPPNYKMIELQKAVSKKFGVSLKKYNSSFKQLQSSSLPWVERGPGNVTGRTRGLIIDPDDATQNTWFAGSVGGGIWKTTDGGDTWTDKTPGLPNLATTVIEMAPSNHNIIYAGTGEGFYNSDAINGDGIFKSTDRGESWVQLASTANNLNFQNINRIIINPNDANIVYACSNVGFYSTNLGPTSGIFKSTDGGNTWNQIYNNSSRIQQLLTNPQNFNTMFATVDGLGVIKSINAGQTWESTNGMYPYGRIEIAMAPTDTSRMYASVESQTGSNLYLSDDAGSNWVLVTDTLGTSSDWLGSQGWYDNTLIVHPYSKDTLFLGGIDIYKAAIVPGADTVTRISGEVLNVSSFLGFINWGGSLFGGGAGTGVEFHGSPINITDSDYTSVEIRFGPGISQKAHRFYYGSNWMYTYQDYVTVPFQVWDVTHNKQLMVSFRDSDQNGVFNLIPYDPSNLQREYIFINAVDYDPNSPDPNIAVTGGMRYKNTFAFWPIGATGSTWDPNSLPASKISISYLKLVTKLMHNVKLTNGYGDPNYQPVHVDHHNFKIIPVNESTNSFRIVNVNDGGASVSNNSGVTWKQITSYQTTQFYGADKNPVDDQYIGGTQDNGTWVSDLNPDKNSPFTKALGGDGFETNWNYDNPDQILGSSYYNYISKTTDKGVSWHSSYSDITDAGNSSNSPFMTKIAKSRLDPDLVFATSASGIWRSDNFADTWTLAPISGHYYSSFSQVAISQANPQIVWAGAVMRSDYGIFVSKDGGLSFNKVNTYSTVAMSRISGLSTHPTNDSTAYVLSSLSQKPKILKTTDLGQTWTDISGFGTGTSSTNGFPDVATYCLLVMPNHPDTIWVGTEIGLFESTNGGANWSLSATGIPSVAIWKMKIVGDQVVVATHGRGIWTVKLPWLAGYTLPVVTKSPRLNNLAQSPDGMLNVEMSLRSPYDSTVVYINSNRALEFASNSVVVDTIVKFPVTTATTDTVQILSYKNNTGYKSSLQAINLNVLSSPVITYENNFNSTTNDFSGQGFSIESLSGFGSPAIHSNHPYANSTNYSYLLLVPITVAPAQAMFSYDDIAIVEPGENGTVFGDQYFYDYVVVEGSADGINWIPLAPGYDCRYNSAWLNAWNTSAAGDSAMFVHHEINLLNNFSAGQKILIRFRLFADVSANGWGWAIDNLSIQPNAVPVELISFGAAAVESSINLTWETATEKNNYGFDIERSQDKKVFEKIGFVGGNGSTTRKHTYSFSDENAPSGRSYYRLKQLDYDGSSTYSNIIEADKAVPAEFRLSQNYPNPFNPSTTIKYQLPVKEKVTLVIYSALGEKIATLIDEIKDAGYYNTVWNGRNNNNTKVASGVYVYRLQAGKFVDTKKMMLVK